MLGGIIIEARYVISVEEIFCEVARIHNYLHFCLSMFSRIRHGDSPVIVCTDKDLGCGNLRHCIHTLIGERIYNVVHGPITCPCCCDPWSL